MIYHVSNNSIIFELSNVIHRIRKYRKTIGKDHTQPFLPNPNFITPPLEICQVHKKVYIQYSTKF